MPKRKSAKKPEGLVIACTICFKKKGVQKVLRTHQEQEHSKNLHFCYLCEMTFENYSKTEEKTTIKDLRDHVRIDHFNGDKHDPEYNRSWEEYKENYHKGSIPIFDINAPNAQQKYSVSSITARDPAFGKASTPSPPLFQPSSSPPPPERPGPSHASSSGSSGMPSTSSDSRSRQSTSYSQQQAPEQSEFVFIPPFLAPSPPLSSSRQSSSGAPPQQLSAARPSSPQPGPSFVAPNLFHQPQYPGGQSSSNWPAPQRKRNIESNEEFVRDLKTPRTFEMQGGETRGFGHASSSSATFPQQFGGSNQIPFPQQQVVPPAQPQQARFESDDDPYRDLATPRTFGQASSSSSSSTFPQQFGGRHQQQTFESDDDAYRDLATPRTFEQATSSSSSTAFPQQFGGSSQMAPPNVPLPQQQFYEHRAQRDLDDVNALPNQQQLAWYSSEGGQTTSAAAPPDNWNPEQLHPEVGEQFPDEQQYRDPEQDYEQGR